MKFNTVREAIATAISVSGGTQTTLGNNIISVGSGLGIDISNDSQQSTLSDWNLIEVTGSGNVGRYGDQVATTIAQWRFISPLDAQSFTANPGWTDIDGADNASGFGLQSIGAIRTWNDQDSGLSVHGAWVNLNSANGPFLEGAGSATWKFTQSFAADTTYTMNAAHSGPTHSNLDDEGHYLFDGSIYATSGPFDFTTGGVIEGFSRTVETAFSGDVALTVAGNPMIIQNAVISVNGDDHHFTAANAQTTGDLRNASYAGDYHRHTGTTSESVLDVTESGLRPEEMATFTIDQLTPGRWYQISTTWDARSYNSSQNAS